MDKPVARMLAALLLAAAAQVPAQESGVDPSADDMRTFEFSMGGTFSDNIARVPDDQEDGTIGRTGLKFDYSTDMRRFDANVNTNLFYEHYFEDTYDDDVIGGLAGDATFGIVPERLLWVVQENFGQIIADPFVADTPENREDVNFFSTGPEVIFHFGSASALILSGRFSDANYETGSLDNEQLSGRVSFERTMSGSSTVSLNLLSESIDFDDSQLNEDYDRDQAYVRYETHASRTGLTLDLGYSQLELEDEKPDGFLGRLTLRRTLSPSSNMSLSVGSQYADSSSLFRQGQTEQGQSVSGIGSDAQNVFATSTPFQSDYALVSYDFQHNRTEFGFDAFYEEESYVESSEFDRKLLAVNARFSRHLGAATILGLFVRYEKEEYENVGFDDEEGTAGAYFSWLIGRRSSIRVQYNYLDRTSTNVESEYTENQLSLFVIWAPFGRP